MKALAMGAGQGGFYAAEAFRCACGAVVADCPSGREAHAACQTAEEETMPKENAVSPMEMDLRNQLRVVRRIQRALEQLPPEQRLKVLVALVTSYENVG